MIPMVTTFFCGGGFKNFSRASNYFFQTYSSDVLPHKSGYGIINKPLSAET